MNISWDGTDFSATASNAPLSLWDGVDTFISHGTVTINRLVSSSDYLFEVDETPDLPGGDSDLGLAGAGLLLSGVITSLTQADPFLDIWTLTANLTLSRLGQGDEVTIDMIGFGLDMAEISPAPAAATPVPEPGSIALLATGLAGLWRRRRRQMA
ncbi:MAG: PEP-CTERM sorting domain-containing protein [Vicinamibacterales bacterium]